MVPVWAVECPCSNERAADIIRPPTRLKLAAHRLMFAGAERQLENTYICDNSLDLWSYITSYLLCAC